MQEIDDFKLIFKTTDKRYKGKVVHGKQLRAVLEDIDSIRFKLLNYTLQLDGKKLKTKQIKLRGGYTKKTKNNNIETVIESDKSNIKSSSEDNFSNEKNDKMTDEINITNTEHTFYWNARSDQNESLPNGDISCIFNLPMSLVIINLVKWRKSFI